MKTIKISNQIAIFNIASQKIFHQLPVVFFRQNSPMHHHYQFKISHHLVQQTVVENIFATREKSKINKSLTKSNFRHYIKYLPTIDHFFQTKFANKSYYYQFKISHHFIKQTIVANILAMLD